MVDELATDEEYAESIGFVLTAICRVPLALECHVDLVQCLLIGLWKHRDS
jgi:hypothetical protein